MNSTLQDVKAQIDGTRKKSGGGYMGRCPCPSHDDTDPSFAFGEGSKYDVVFHCFAGCAPENIIDALGLDRGAARGAGEASNKRGVREAKKALSELPPSLKEEDPAPTTADPVCSMDQVFRWRDALWEQTGPARAARTYLIEERGLTEDSLRVACVGLSYDDRSAAEWWVAIPVITPGAEVCTALKAFGFNPRQGQWATQRGRKVARNAESGLLRYVRKEVHTPVVICEGEIDALSCLTAGVNAVTVTTGAQGFSKEEAWLVSKMVPAKRHGVVVAFDGDETGREAAGNVQPMMRRAGVDASVASLPEGADINDCLQQGGPPALWDLLESTHDWAAPKTQSPLPEPQTT